MFEGLDIKKSDTEFRIWLST